MLVQWAHEEYVHDGRDRWLVYVQQYVLLLNKSDHAAATDEVLNWNHQKWILSSQYGSISQVTL